MDDHLQQLLQHAFDIEKKPSKEAAGTLIKDIWSKYYEVWDAYDLATFSSLYRYFIPPLPTNPKTVEQWVALATQRQPKPEPTALKYLYGDGHYIYGTNGHRMHRAPSHLSGIYHAKTLDRVEADLLYPNCDQFFQFTFTYASLPVLEVEERNGLICYRLPETTLFYQKQYVDEALSFGGEVEFAVKDERILYLRLGERDAVIMPYQV